MLRPTEYCTSFGDLARGSVIKVGRNNQGAVHGCCNNTEHSSPSSNNRFREENIKVYWCSSSFKCAYELVGGVSELEGSLPDFRRNILRIPLLEWGPIGP
jgi:hypothetical protein